MEQFLIKWAAHDVTRPEPILLRLIRASGFIIRIFKGLYKMGLRGLNGLNFTELKYLLLEMVSVVPSFVIPMLFVGKKNDLSSLRADVINVK
ncbi:hypothetical protein VNO77_09690 [Canavalia gladiata]|uniref:Uncharacterized protein n=1 Tax=Canavalia gladiata TaxID=3824 RepID=A0AAN9MA81_CANGL